MLLGGHMRVCVLYLFFTNVLAECGHSGFCGPATGGLVALMGSSSGGAVGWWPVEGDIDPFSCTGQVLGFQESDAESGFGNQYSRGFDVEIRVKTELKQR